jgi:hypothetical protein
MTELNLTQFATKMGVSLQAVQDAIKLGRLSKSVQKEGRTYRIDEELGAHEWVANRNPNRVHNPTRAEKQGKPNPFAGALDKLKEKAWQDIKDRPEEFLPEIGESRKTREAYAAKLTKIEYEEKSGSLVSADKVKATAFAVGQKVRSAMLNIPARIAPEVAAEVDPFRVEQILDNEIRQALEELASGE